MQLADYLKQTGQSHMVVRKAPKPDMSHRGLVALELAKAGDDDKAAAEHAAAGLQECAEYRRGIARRRREEARGQGAVRYGLMPE